MQGSEDADVVSTLQQVARKRGRNLAEPARLGERRDLRGQETDALAGHESASLPQRPVASARSGWMARTAPVSLRHESNVPDGRAAPPEFRRIARAIEFVAANARQQPSLAEIAAAANWSEYHFAREFRRWTGISPKQWLQQLSLTAAKQALDDERSVLQAALDAGLSGSRPAARLVRDARSGDAGRIQVAGTRPDAVVRDGAIARSARC